MRQFQNFIIFMNSFLNYGLVKEYQSGYYYIMALKYCRKQFCSLIDEGFAAFHKATWS